MTAQQFGGCDRCFDVINGQHEQTGMRDASGFKQIQTRRIAIVNRIAETAHEIDLLRALVECRKGDALRAEHARDDLAEAAETGNDDGPPLIFNMVEFALWFFFKARCQ